MSFNLKLDLPKLLKLTDSQSWTPSAVQAIISELNRKIPTELMNASNRAFDKETAPDGTPWQPRSPKYVQELTKRKQAKRKILSITSHLRKSRQTFNNGTTAGIGTNLAYARIHQFGGQAGRNHRATIPARPYLGFDKYAHDKIIALTEKLLKKHLSGK